ncbi:MAG TPA: RT0821/Lpp0805 family surface protein [Acidisoma sp.]|jgi:hypothetical protein|nr:RT0821/Lpp0805 family surface protein [Acidisoma sp.]
MLRSFLSVLVATFSLGAVLAPVLSSHASAQAMQTYLPRRLTGTDVDILRNEAAKLGPNGPKEERWHNPKTGNSGVVTFLRQYDSSGRECRSFRYTFHTGAPNDGLPYKLNWCEQSSGRWAIAQ